jgi:glycosyltransferase involved in cell wall biosynthesis
MNSGEPKISVIVPTYNRATMLYGCIEATLSQTMTDFELIIVSDGSTDETETVARSYGDPRIVFLEKDNGGQASARNLGIRSSKGKYIALCDDDDRFYPDHLLTLTNLLESSPEVALVYSDALWCNRDSNIEASTRYSQDFDKKTLENYNYITPVNVLFKKSCLKKSGLFNEDPALKGLEDWDFFLRLSDHYPLLHIRKVTSKYCIHESNSLHSGSGYDYNLAFFLIRNERFRHLLSKFGLSFFNHVNHMYPFYFVQCYLNNQKMGEGLEAAKKLQRLYKLYTARRKPTVLLTELVILFSLGISSFMAGYQQEARRYFNKILESHSFGGIKKQFNAFVGQYADSNPNAGLKALLINCFSLLE